MTVRTTCRTVVFANPDPRQSAVVAWGDFARAVPDSTVTIPAGRAVRVAVSRSRLDWAAGRVGVDAGRLGATGRGDRVAVDQGCRTPDRSLTAVVSAPCLARRQPVTVLTVGADADADLNWWVNRQGSPLTMTDGVLTPGRPTPVDLSRFGPGRYELTVAAGSTVLDHTDFALLDCVTTTVDCTAVTWANPAGNSAVTVAFRDGSTVQQAVQLAAGQSARVTTAGAVRWAATAVLDEGSRPSDAGAETKVGLDDTCAADVPTRLDSVVIAGAGDAAGPLSSTPTSPVTLPTGTAPGDGSGWPVAGALLAAVAALGVGLGARVRRRRT
ncbi:MAG: hypothetical protein ACR2LI_01795 [Propionibacteriaceae bacterium]